ncbi:MAG: acyl-CoA dehydratase activase, partial [Kiritimatiellae bacterium]|nr:acyl-CoA dehydratase activase [Kiritimatiellia bacterium]
MAEKEQKLFLGIDIGSTTFKAVLMDGDGGVLRTVYKRTQPVEAGKVACTGRCSGCGACSGGSVKRLALEFLKVAGVESFQNLAAVVVTGSQIVEDTRKFIPFDFQVSEVTAHVAGARFLHPDVDAIIDCGGQDSKCMVYNPSMKLWTSMMSGVCAAGTGSFLDSVAAKLGVKIEEVADKVNYDSNTEFSSVCAVLSATSINKFKNRVPIGDLLAGACKAQARTILNSVGQLLLNAPGRKILFQGGVAFNKAVAFFLKKLTGSEIVIPQYPEVMGARGAAVIARPLNGRR